jgi:hypothetical protein
VRRAPPLPAGRHDVVHLEHHGGSPRVAHPLGDGADAVGVGLEEAVQGVEGVRRARHGRERGHNLPLGLPGGQQVTHVAQVLAVPEVHGRYVKVLAPAAFQPHHTLLHKVLTRTHHRLGHRRGLPRQFLHDGDHRGGQAPPLVQVGFRSVSLVSAHSLCRGRRHAVPGGRRLMKPASRPPRSPES